VQAGSSLVAFVLRSLLSGSSKSFLKELPTQGFYQLALPQGWELFGLDGAFGYPTSEHPWLVTFDPCVYRKSEIKALQARRAIGEESEHVHFLSAAHPIVNAALRRFKNKIRANGNIPVLASETPLAEKCMLLFEVVLPASGEKSITLWRGLDTVSPNGNRLNNTDLSKIVETLRPVRAADSFEKQMPTDREWERMVEQGISNGIEQAKDFIHENKKTTEVFRNDAAKQKSVLEAIQQQREKKKLPKYLESLANARGQWLSELWEPLIHPDTKEPVVRFAPLAIVLNSGKSR
jgi:hypothetical protein